MVYSQDFLDSTLDNINNMTAMSGPSSSSSSGPVVQVLFKGSGVHSIGGPTPFVELSTSVESNSVGIPESTTTKITLTGKIVRPQAASATGSGISHVLSGIKQLNDLFTPDTFGEFKITCNSSTAGGGGSSSASDLYSVTGVRVVSVDVSKTSDNWVQTADYTVVLEGYKSAISGYSVKGLVDSWSIESLEDYTYSSFTINNITQKTEYDNPNLKPTAGSTGSQQPGGSQTGGSSGGNSPNTSSASLNVITIPQFKVTHTVGAIGVPSGSGSTTGLMNSTYLNAKAWVESRLNLSLTSSSSTPSGVISLSGSAGTPAYNLATGYLYNHIRNTNFSIMESKYEVVDNWIAMPTGIGFVEDYSIDMSTDERYIHTVSVKGEIRGLSLGGSFGASHTHVTGSSLVAPSTTGYGGGLAHNVPDVTSSASTASNITANKYENAISGWIYDIKPYLYRRACVAMSTIDRSKGYVAPYSQGGGSQSPPNNPVYSKHGLLNIIPVSTSESHNTRKGTIAYSYDFNNKFTMISGVIAESVSIEDTGPVDVIGEAFVLGRALGPVLQNLGTKTTAKKSVSIEVTVVPPSSLAGFFMQNSACPLWTGGTIFTTITGILEALKPFGDRASSFIGSSSVTRVGAATNATGQVFIAKDDQSWDPTNGKYVRAVGWNYQQCTNANNWLNH
jgi:hypothetical protein